MKFEYKQHKGGSRSLRDSHVMSVDLTLDLLYGCEFHCPGCFVNKKMPFVEGDLKMARELSDIWKEAKYDFNEIFLGPTDIFSASNFDTVILNEDFQYVANQFTFTCTSTLMGEYEEIDRRLTLLKEKCNHNGREFEIFIVLDLEKYLAQDEEYLTKLNKNLELFELHNTSFDKTNAFFTVNVHDEHMFDDISLSKLNKRIRKDFNTKIRINPSFFRGTSKRHIEKYATLYKNLLEEQVHEDTIKGIFLNMIDVYFGGFTFLNYAIMNHNLYIAPLLYEAVPQIDEMFLIQRDINDKYSNEQLIDAETALMLRQYKYANKTDECDNCQHLSTCVSRGTLAYMESRDITQCLMPKSLFRDASKIIELEKKDDRK